MTPSVFYLILPSYLVAIEDLKVKNMVKNHHLAKSISDASWRLFREWLEYFGKVFGKVVIAVPPHYTSVNCSSCGATVKKSLSTRTHTCACGAELCRDENAAKSILIKGLNAVGRTVSRGYGTFRSGGTPEHVPFQGEFWGANSLRPIEGRAELGSAHSPSACGEDVSLSTSVASSL